MSFTIRDVGHCNRALPGAGWSAVRQPVFLDSVAVGLEHHLGAAMLSDLLGGPLDHAVALARLGKQHLAGAGDLEALLGARLGFDLGIWLSCSGKRDRPVSSAMRKS